MKSSAEYQADWRKRNREKANATQLEYYYKNHERMVQERREYKRRHYLTVNGELLRVAKRAWPNGVCEICGSLNDSLDYHHWDDTNPKLGVWVCGGCHFLVGAFEKGNAESRLAKYQNLKATISALEENGLFDVLVEHCLT